jgi:polysaccharide export outer membrane protein
MRLCRLLVLLLIAAANAGCAGLPGPAPEVAIAPPEAAPPDLDSFMYGRRTPYAAPVAAPLVAPVPPGVAVSPFREPIAVPVGPMPVPASVVPGPAPGNNGMPYTLDSGDRLRIVVFGQEGLSNIYTVDVSGKIAMPLIGVVSARGCTTAQLARLISDRLRQGYIREPHVAVEVEIYRPFFILGEVIAPGQYPYVPNMTIETAVAIAGGFTPRAYRYDVEVSRSADGVTSRQKVPMIAPVRPGDTINVSERWF